MESQEIIEYAQQVDWESFDNAYPDYSVSFILPKLLVDDDTIVVDCLGQLFGKCFHQETYYEILIPGIELFNMLLQCPAFTKCHILILQFYKEVAQVPFYLQYGLLTPFDLTNFDDFHISDFVRSVYDKLNNSIEIFLSLFNESSRNILLELLSYLDGIRFVKIDRIVGNEVKDIQSRIFCTILASVYNMSINIPIEKYPFDLLNKQELEVVDIDRLILELDLYMENFNWINGEWGIFVADMMMTKCKKADTLFVLLGNLFTYIHLEKLRTEKVEKEQLNINQLILENPQLSFIEIAFLIEKRREQLSISYPLKWKILLSHIIAYTLLVNEMHEFKLQIVDFLKKEELEFDVLKSAKTYH